MKNIISKLICVSEEVELSKFETEHNLMILESNHIDGYYNSVPQEMNNPLENHYFLLMKKNIPCFQDRVIRSISFYQRDTNEKLHVYPGHMNVHGNEYNFIRFRKNEFEKVIEMIPYFEKRNIEFIKPRRFSAVRTLIQFKEMVEMEEMKPNIYRDKSAHHIFFLPIALDVEYITFSKMLSYIRNNCDFKQFEASLVYSVNKQYKIDDYAKIYSPNCEEERLDEFNDNFNKAAKEFGLL